MKTGIISLALLISFTWGCGGKDKNKIEASGIIEATNITISSKVSGQIEEILKDEGSLVKTGDTLLTIDHEMSDIQLKQAVAGKDLAEAQFRLLKSGARAEDIAQAQEALKQAQVNFEQASIDKERMNSLYNSNSITKKQYEDALLRYQVSQAQLNGAQENFRKMKNLARPDELRQAEANLAKSAASADIFRKNIRDSYVITPVNGVVAKKFIEAGETVNPSSSLLKISDLSVVELIIYVSEEELGKVKLGQTARVSVDAFPDKTYEGRVIYISPEAEFTPKNIQTKDERTKLVFAVKIEADNPNFELKPGMPADAVIRL
ncbi:MAG: efflux RND transporter periplasmic adaptor subunit [Ignavibacteria bacterium]